MNAADRERQIVEQATAYFAEVGLDGTTRELARRIGITQPLLYRYFQTKQDLLERVYQEIYVNRWNPEWERILRDDVIVRFRDRLVAFYWAYSRAIFQYDWCRMFMFTVMAGTEPERNRVLLNHIENKVITPICIGTRAHASLPPPEEVPIGAMERELVWNLHGGIFYIAARRDIYGIPLHHDADETIDASVDRYLHGVSPVLTRILAR